MEVPLSVEETYPVTLSYWPSVAPVTVTLKVQEPPAANDPPVNAIVRVAAVVVNVPPHWDVDEFAIDKPDGKTSLNVTPVNARFPAAVLLRVKVNVEVEPLTIGFGEKDLEIVGAGAGILQPVKETSLKYASAPELSLFAPVPVIRIVVDPVVLAELERSIVLVFQAPPVNVAPVYVAAVPEPVPV